MARPYVDYKNKMISKRIDFDKGLGYQCVDLFKDYMQKVLGISVLMSGNAKEIWTNKYHVFKNGWEMIPGTNNLMQGDIIVSTIGNYGHVAILDRIVGGKIFVLEQNGSGKNSGNGIGANAIRVQPYAPTFRKGVRRCKKIFENLQAEREYIRTKLELKIKPVDKMVTEDYKKSIRYIG